MANVCSGEHAFVLSAIPTSLVVNGERPFGGRVFARGSEHALAPASAARGWSVSVSVLAPASAVLPIASAAGGRVSDRGPRPPRTGGRGPVSVASL